MGRSPLDHPRLAAIERKLDAGELEEAQHLLAQLGPSSAYRHATAYLTTRLLYQRGHLDERGVIERLEHLIEEVEDFPEAYWMLNAARNGGLRETRGAFKSSRPPPAGLGDGPKPEPEVVRAPRPDAVSFPRAARVPRISDVPARPHDPSRPPSIPDLDVPGGSRPPPGFPADPRPLAVEPEPTLEPPPARGDDESSARYSASSEEVLKVAPRPGRTRPWTGPPTEEDRAPEPRPSRPPPVVEPGPEIHSAAPPAVERSSASLFEVAELLDAGRLDDALTALEGRGPSDEPEHILMEARALERAGRKDEARERIERIARAPLVEPEVRAGVARLALELDQTELALAQARRAYKEDPTQPLVRMSLAWAALRTARREASSELVALAAKALRDLGGEGGPHEALLLSLRACLEAHAGDAQRAFELAEIALSQAPTADALAALAMAAARLRRPSQVLRASARLREVSPTEAKALEASVLKYEDRLFELGPNDGTTSNPVPTAQATATWGPLELAIVERRHDDAWERFSQLASDTHAQLEGPAQHEPPALALIAASFLTQAPVSRDFAPYDQTPWSLARVEALLRVLAPGVPGDFAIDHPLVTLVAGYVGETLRIFAGGRWRDDQRVVAPTGEWDPASMVHARLVARRSFGNERLLELANEATTAIERHPPAVTPPYPWAPAHWPSPARMSIYALALRSSVIARYAFDRTEIPLDGSLDSLRGLDAWLDLISPPLAPRPANAIWARRAIALAGAYLGDTLADATHGKWAAEDGHELGPGSYQIVLAPGVLVRPVEHVALRISSGAVSCHEWALGVLEQLD